MTPDEVWLGYGWSFVRTALPDPPAEVLEIGCGTRGGFVPALRRDGYTATGVDPFEVLVVPRLLGLAIALPLLTVIADLVGLAGGAVLSHYLLNISLVQFLNRANEAISPTTFWVGIIKAPVFALLIGLAGCRRGMQVRGSARVLGGMVTAAVVQAIFLVILADALFAVFFLKLDI